VKKIWSLNENIQVISEPRSVTSAKRGPFQLRGLLRAALHRILWVLLRVGGRELQGTGVVTFI